MDDLAATADSVRQAIDRYWDGAHSNMDLIKDAARVKQWKCYRNQEGEWRCGPSRFVGYEGMTPDEYIMRKKSKDGGLNGTNTEYHLRKWTDSVSEDSELHWKLYGILADYLEKAGISVNQTASFSVLRSAPGGECQESDDPEQEYVEALFVLSKSLSPNSRRSLIRRLETLQ